MTSPDAELQSLTTSIEDVRHRVATLAQELEASRREDASSALFEAERSLTAAVRQLALTRRRLS